MPRRIPRAVTGSPGFARGEGVRTMPPRKAPKRWIPSWPVPQTDTGGQVEQTKARGRNHVKELGKPAPQLRDKGRSRGSGGQAPPGACEPQ